jgi:HPt (histidine-containing phosphotransfer) domain-containing protein
VTKPIDIDGLVATLAGLLGGERVEAPSGEAGVRGSPLVSSLAGKPAVARIARKFVLRLPQAMAAAQQARLRNDFEELAGFAHWLTGIGGSVGYEDFTEPARRLERGAKAHDAEGVDEALAELQGLADRVVAPEEQAEAQAAVRDPAGASQPPIVSRLAGNARLRPIIHRFSGRLRDRLAALDSGQQPPDCEAAAAFAHWLAGSAGSLGYDDFVVLARRLEWHATNRERERLEPILRELQAMAQRISVPEPGDATASKLTA